MGGRHQRLLLEIAYWGSRLFFIVVLRDWVSDVALYQQTVGLYFREGKLPFRDFPFEYPPLAYALLFWPAWVQETLGLPGLRLYRILWALPLLAADRAVFTAYCRRNFSLGAYYLGLSFLLPFLLFARLDLLVGFCIAWPLLRGKSGRWAWALGGALKLVPLLLVPFAALASVAKGRRSLLGYVALGGPLLASVALVAWLEGGKVSFLGYHSERGVQVETLLGSGAMVLHAAGGLPNLRVVHKFKSHQLEGVGGLEWAAKVFFWLSLLGGGGVLLWALRRRRVDALGACWIFLVGFLCGGYVLSPQFWLWLLPLAPLVAHSLPEKRRGAFSCLFSATVLLTGVHFFFYWQYVWLSPAFVALVGVRNGLLLALLVVSWAWLIKPAANTPPSILAEEAKTS